MFEVNVIFQIMISEEKMAEEGASLEFTEPKKKALKRKMDVDVGLFIMISVVFGSED